MDMDEVNNKKGLNENKISVTLLHEILGRMSESKTITLVKHLCYDLGIGSITPCDTWDIVKAKQKNLTKDGCHVLETNGKNQLFVYIWTIKNQNNGIKVTLTKKILEF